MTNVLLPAIQLPHLHSQKMSQHVNNSVTSYTPMIRMTLSLWLVFKHASHHLHHSTVQLAQRVEKIEIHAPLRVSLTTCLTEIQMNTTTAHSSVIIVTINVHAPPFMTISLLDQRNSYLFNTKSLLLGTCG